MQDPRRGPALDLDQAAPLLLPLRAAEAVQGVDQRRRVDVELGADGGPVVARVDERAVHVEDHRLDAFEQAGLQDLVAGESGQAGPRVAPRPSDPGKGDGALGVGGGQVGRRLLGAADQQRPRADQPQGIQVEFPGEEPGGVEERDVCGVGVDPDARGPAELVESLADAALGDVVERRDAGEGGGHDTRAPFGGRLQDPPARLEGLNLRVLCAPALPCAGLAVIGIDQPRRIGVERGARDGATGQARDPASYSG